jgi:D-threo-aldose 1-dehydrogenase
MNNWYDQSRPLGRTGLDVPRVVFGTAALGNVGRVMTDQAKVALCGEFLRQFSPPAWIETSYAYGDGMAVEVLGRALRRLEVTRDEVVVQLTVDAAGVRSVAECWEKSCGLLGDPFRPKLLAIRDANEQSWQAARELKTAGEVRGIGLAVSDWQRVGACVAAMDPDWVMLRGCTVMRHPMEVLETMSALAMGEVPIVLCGLFEGGFLVGANRLDGRTLRAEDVSDRSLLAWRKAFVALCDGHGISPSDACIQFALTAPGVDAVRLESSYADRVVQNVNSLRQKVPEGFWESMKEEGLLSESLVLSRIRMFGEQ